MADGSIHIDTKIDSSGLEKQLESLKGSLEDIGKTLSVAVTAPIVAMGAFATKAFSDAEKGDARLRASLEMTGQNVESMFQKYQQLGSAIQEVTDIDDDAVKSLATFGTQLGITSDQMESAIKGAIGLSKITGADLQQSMKMVAMAAQGEFAMLERLSPEMRAAKTDSEKLAIAQKLMANGYKLATAEGKTFSGLMSMIKNDIGDLGEQFGQIIAEALLPFVRWFRDVVKGFQQLSSETKKTIVAIAAVVAAIGPALLAFAQMVKAVQMVRAAFVALEGAQIAVAATTAGIAALIIGWVALAILAFTDWGNAIADLPVGLQKALVEMLKLVIDFTKKFLDKIENIMNVLYGLTALVGVGIFGKAAFEGLQFLVKKASENVDAELEKIKTRADKTKPSIDKFGAALDDIQAKADNMAGGVSGAADAVEELDYKTQNFAFLLGRNLRELAGEVSITDTVKNMFRNFSQEFANAESTLFMIGFGINEEIAKGISAGLHIATSAAKGAATMVVKAFQLTMDILTKGLSILSWMADFSPKDIFTSLETFIEDIKNFLFEDLGSIPIFVEMAAGLIESFLKTIDDNLPMLTETLGNVIMFVADFLSKNAGPLISSLMPIVAAFIKVLVDSAPGLVDALMKAFIGALESFASSGIAQDLAMGFAKIIGTLAQNIAPLIAAFVDVIIALFDGLVKSLPVLIPAIVDLIMNLVKGVSEAIPQLILAIQDALPAIVDAFSSPEMMTLISDVLIAIAMAMIPMLPTLIVSLIKAIAKIIVNNPQTLTKSFYTIAGDAVNGFIRGFQEYGGRIWSGVREVFTKFIDAVKNFFGIHSPSTLFKSFGRDIIMGLIEGIKSMLSFLSDIAKMIGNAIISSLGNPATILFDFGKKLVSGLIDGLKSMFNALKDVVDAAKKLVGSFPSIPGLSGGGSSGNGLIDTILNPGGLIPGIGGGGISIPKPSNPFKSTALAPSLSTVGGSGGITLNNVMNGTLVVDGREIGRIAFNNLDYFAAGAYGYKR
jgi:phage-related protein